MFCFSEEPPQKTPKTEKTSRKQTKKTSNKTQNQKPPNKTTKRKLRFLKWVGVLKRKNGNSHKSLVEVASVPHESQQEPPGQQAMVWINFTHGSKMEMWSYKFRNDNTSVEQAAT